MTRVIVVVSPAGLVPPRLREVATVIEADLRTREGLDTVLALVDALERERDEQSWP